VRIAAPRFEFVEDRRFQIRQRGEEAIGDAVFDDIAQGLHRIEFGTVSRRIWRRGVFMRNLSR
jgi:hypothetical protein